jgi:hypothetical protein
MSIASPIAWSFAREACKDWELLDSGNIRRQRFEVSPLGRLLEVNVAGVSLALCSEIFHAFSRNCGFSSCRFFFQKADLFFALKCFSLMRKARLLPRFVSQIHFLIVTTWPKPPGQRVLLRQDA